MLRMILFLIGKGITELPTIYKHSLGFNPFYSEGRISILYYQYLVSIIKKKVKASCNESKE